MRQPKISSLLLLGIMLLGVACSPQPTAEDPAEQPIGDAAQDVNACEVGFRLFADELLVTDPICIPEEPQRIITLEPYSYETLYALDVEQIGTVSLAKLFLIQNFPTFEEDLAGIEEIGFPPNPERILALEPDLILGTNLPFITDIYDDLSAIAPTVLADVTVSGQWQDAQRFFAEVVGQPDAMDALFESYQQRIAEFQTALDADPAQIEASIVRVRGDGIAISNETVFPSIVVRDTGLDRPEGQLEREETVISFEELQAADGDAIFVWSQEANPNTLQNAQDLLAELQNDPLWASLDAVQNDRVYVVGSHWIGYGFPSAHAVLDDLFVHLTDVDPAEVSPNPFREEGSTP